MDLGVIMISNMRQVQCLLSYSESRKCSINMDRDYERGGRGDRGRSIRQGNGKVRAKFLVCIH